MRVGSAAPPGCPETNWQLEKLWLQGKASRARDGDKEGGDRRERKATRHNNTHKGRAGSAKCGQQSLYLGDADSPPSYPLSEGDKTERRGRERLHSDTHLSPRSFFYPPPPARLLPRALFLNNTLEWRTTLLLTPPSTLAPFKVHVNKASSSSSPPSAPARFSLQLFHLQIYYTCEERSQTTGSAWSRLPPTSVRKFH